VKLEEDGRYGGGPEPFGVGFSGKFQFRDKTLLCHIAPGISMQARTVVNKRKPRQPESLEPYEEAA
jgi:hypothetical protein